MNGQLTSAIARILQANQRVVGAGFLLSDQHILTCAHVINAALGKQLNASDKPSQEVCLDFPLVASGKILRGRVVRWIPVQPSSSILPKTGADIALLELKSTLPEGTQPVRLVTAEDLWNHRFRVFGFPKGKSEGVWADGIIRGSQGNGRVHIEVLPSAAFRIESGFSGSSIWDEQLDGIVGMTVAIDPLRPENRAAFIIPTTQLINACPELEKQAIPPCPYRGLFVFREQDAQFFFGRETFTEQLVEAVQRQSLVVVIGASGSGKSSVVFAGLIPQLRSEEGWLIESFRPGDRPLRNLAARLVPLLETEMSETDQLVEVNKLADRLQQGELGLEDVVRRILEKNSDSRLLLIADQFEELYTLYPDNLERQIFLDQLLEAVNQTENFTLVLTLRADFFGYALSYRPFADALQDAVQTIGPMNREELQEAIEKPAQLLGVRLESGLTERILKAVEKEPGNLPLLEFALTLLWDKQQNGQLTHQAYEDIGGVEKALAEYAEKQYGSLSEEDKQRTQRVFIQLVRPGEGTEDTRRLATRDEVGEDNWDLVTQLASARLVVTGVRLVVMEWDEPEVEETVEIVHEALILEWQRLRNWMESNREFRTWQERLKTRIQEWKEGKGELLSKTRLRIAEEWRQKRAQELSPEQNKFIRLSRQRQKRNWWLVRGIGGLIVIIASWTGAEIYKKSCDVGERVGQDCFRFIITSGDSKLFVGTTNIFLQDGIEDFNSAFLDLYFLGKFVSNWGKFEEAEKDFKKAKEAAPYDPIPLIYYNNAKALKRGNPYKLAVVVPVDAHEEVAINMLRGVASAQNEFNCDTEEVASAQSEFECKERKDSALLEIIIANDKNDNKGEIGKKVAEKLIKKDVLGIVGHRSSGSSLAAIPIYDENKISMVSPTSGSTKLDQYPVFFRTVASNKEFAKNFYEYAKEKCFNENKNNQVWLIYDSDAEYSNNLKDKFDEYREKSEELKEQFDEISLNDLLNKDEKGLKKEIKDKIEQKGVRCAILLPSTKTTSAAISIVYAQNNLELPREQKIQFLSALALHNDETLKKDRSSFEEDLKIVVPIPLLERTILDNIQNRWGGNVNWRTYTSYRATLYLIKGLEQLDGKNPDEKSTTSKKRKLVLDYLKMKQSSLDSLKSCLMDSKDIQYNKYDESKCIKIKGYSKE